MASVCEISVCATAYYLHPNVGYALWTLAVIALLIVRLSLIAICCKRSARNEPTPTSLFLLASVLWSALLGLGALLCNISGDQTLFLLGNVCAVGVVGGLAGRNAGIPRLVLIQISVIFTLLGIGAALSPASGKIVLLFQAPFCAAGFFTVAIRSNKDTVALLLAQETSNRLARHDSLTGLPNRARISELLLNRTDAEPTLRPGSFAVLLIDLDGFKAINDSLGHAAGDLVLQESAKRLRAVLRQGDVVGRLAGDEFVAISSDAAISEEVRLLADQIVKTLARPFVLNEALVRIGASVGISQYPEHGETGPQLLICADRALYAVKRSGKSAFAVFDAKAHASDDSLSLLRSDLEGALQSFGSGLRMEYQPIVNLASGLVTGTRSTGALDPSHERRVAAHDLRSHCRADGPDPAAGEWVLRRSCAEAARWREPVVVAVNVSPVQLREDSFADLVAAVMQDSGLPPSRLNIEVTETVLMSDDVPTRRNVEKLRAMGIGLALDDFGTGFSTLSNLCRFSFDTLKIDSSFVRESIHRRESAAVVRGIVALAHELGIPTTAEGIETCEQLSFVRASRMYQRAGLFPRPLGTRGPWVRRLPHFANLSRSGPKRSSRKSMMLRNFAVGRRSCA
jgi:diguanylate cyclase (GGDEF)-like protein